MKLPMSVLAFVFLGNIAAAQASPVDVSYSVSGSAGNWLLDFSVSNNLGDTNDLYLFGVLLPTRNIAGSPAGWDPNAINSINWSIYGGSNTNYDDIWITCPAASCPANHPITVVGPGRTLSGFQALSTDLTAPSGVSWFAVASGGLYTGPGCSFICGAPFSNPGFEGLASSVPEPESWTLMLLGLAALGFTSLRSKRKMSQIG